MPPTLRHYLLSIPAAAIVYLVSCLDTMPKTTPWGMGVEYAAMSADPLGGVGDHPYRVLGPLLAYVTGLGGDGYWLFSHLTTLLFLALVFVVAMRDTRSSIASFVVVAVWGSSLANQMWKMHVGYAEPLTFATMLLSMLCVQRTWWFWGIQLLALLNHEAIVFVWPWLLLEKRARGTIGARDLVGAVAALGAYGLARAWLTRNATDTLQSVAWYWNDQTISMETVGMWALIVPFVSVAFGAQSAIVGWHAGRDGFRRGAMPSLVMLGTIGAMLLLAVDLQRFICFLALPVMIGAIRMARHRHGALILALLAISTPFAIRAQAPFAMTIVRTMYEVGADSVARFFPDVIVRIWPIYTGYLVALVALVAGGAWLGRRTRDAVERQEREVASARP